MSDWTVSALGGVLAAVLFLRRRGRCTESTDDAGREETKTGSTTELDQPFFPGVRYLFGLDFERFTHLNHGSYGTVPKRVLAEKTTLAEEVESFPDDFYRRRALGRFKRAASEVAKLVGSSPDNLTFVTNATTGVNSALRSIPFKAGDAVLTTTTTYNACANAVRDMRDRLDLEIVSVDMKLAQPGSTLSVEEIRSRSVAAVTAALEAHPNIRVALLDHISSMPAIIMPLDALSPVLRKHGVMILIDGAHAPGQLPLNLSSLDVDWYTGNLHKWAFSPKGSAFLYSAPTVRDSTVPVVTSHFWKMGLHERFFMQGTNDQTPYLAVPKALSVVAEPQPAGLGGWDAVRSYNRNLMLWATKHLSGLWGTEPLVSTDACMFMSNIRTPLKWQWFVKPGTSLADAKADYQIAERIATSIWGRSGIQCVFLLIDDSIYTRISCNVYNTKADYVKYGKAVLDLCDTMNAPGAKPFDTL